MAHEVVPADTVRTLAAELLCAHGVPPADAATIADCLVRADLRGVHSHGVIRLPGYLDRVRKGLINPAVDLAPRRVSPAAVSIDGQDGFGFVVATRAMSEAISLAGETGLGVASAYRSTHFGMAACYALNAVEAGYIGLVFTNASPGLAPWGARSPLMGTSPLAAGAPGGPGGDFLLDMSPAVAARGKIRQAVRQDATIPADWALDAEGRPTTDPRAALDGVMLPIGGPKGSGLSILMDILGGVISGAAFGGEVGDMTRDFDRPQNVGHFFLALRPDLFLSMDSYLERMATLMRRIRAAPRADGVDEIVMPGEREARLERVRRVEGIPYDTADIAPLRQLAAELKV